MSFPVVGAIQRRDLAIHDARRGRHQRAHGCGGHTRLVEHHERRVPVRPAIWPSRRGLRLAARMPSVLRKGSSRLSCMWRHEASSRSAARLPRFFPLSAAKTAANIPECRHPACKRSHSRRAFARAVFPCMRSRCPAPVSVPRVLNTPAWAGRFRHTLQSSEVHGSGVLRHIAARQSARLQCKRRICAVFRMTVLSLRVAQIRCSIRMEVPVAHEGRVVVPSEYLELLVRQVRQALRSAAPASPALVATRSGPLAVGASPALVLSGELEVCGQRTACATALRDAARRVRSSRRPAAARTARVCAA